MKVSENIRSLVPSGVKTKLKRLLNKGIRESERQNKRIDKLPRFVETHVVFLGKKIRIVDNASFQFIRKELFGEQIYKFDSAESQPYIIDCGANIGLSVIYFKQLYPKAEIIAFEPDEKVFNALQYNVNSFGFSNVEVIKKACWNEETTLQFYSEGADGGRICHDDDSNKMIEVKTIRLRNYLDRKVDFLKIDIEGAETKVLRDSADLLGNVDKLFVEFHSFNGQEQTLGELIQILSNAGFRYQVQHVGAFSPRPFMHIVQYNNIDLQLNIFAYRP